MSVPESYGFKIYQDERKALQEKNGGQFLINCSKLRAYEMMQASASMIAHLFRFCVATPCQCVISSCTPPCCFTASQIPSNSLGEDDADMLCSICTGHMLASCCHASHDLIRLPLAPTCPEVDYVYLNLEKRKNMMDEMFSVSSEDFKEIFPLPKPRCMKE
jgi:hypothetical protein